MPNVVIHKLGPVDHCELEINDFTVFTGPQASGKSTEKAHRERNTL